MIRKAFGNFAHVLGIGGLIEEALEASLAGAQRVRRHRDELRYHLFLDSNAAEMLIELGRYAEAADLLAPHLANQFPGVRMLEMHIPMARLALRTGDIGAARRHLEIARSAARDLEVVDVRSTSTSTHLGPKSLSGTTTQLRP